MCDTRELRIRRLQRRQVVAAGAAAAHREPGRHGGAWQMRQCQQLGQRGEQRLCGRQQVLAGAHRQQRISRSHDRLHAGHTSRADGHAGQTCRTLNNPLPSTGCLATALGATPAQPSEHCRRLERIRDRACTTALSASLSIVLPRTSGPRLNAASNADRARGSRPSSRTASSREPSLAACTGKGLWRTAASAGHEELLEVHKPAT